MIQLLGREKKKKKGVGGQICLKERLEGKTLIIPCSKLSETGSSGREGKRQS